MILQNGSFLANLLGKRRNHIKTLIKIVLTTHSKIQMTLNRIVFPDSLGESYSWKYEIIFFRFFYKKWPFLFVPCISSSPPGFTVKTFKESNFVRVKASGTNPCLVRSKTGAPFFHLSPIVRNRSRCFERVGHKSEYRKVASSRPVYYSIFEHFGMLLKLRCANNRGLLYTRAKIWFLNFFGVLLTETCSCSRLCI